jgi:pyruvate,orthophosphate dikinase
VKPVILVRVETSPEDITACTPPQGILTSARRHDQPRGGGGPRHGPACVAGAGEIRIDYKKRCPSPPAAG